MQLTEYRIQVIVNKHESTHPCDLGIAEDHVQCHHAILHPITATRGIQQGTDRLLGSPIDAPRLPTTLPLHRQGLEMLIIDLLKPMHTHTPLGTLPVSHHEDRKLL